ncbi:MAG: dihydrodipicolinate synthase family protein [Chitinophagales bacterium]
MKIEHLEGLIAAPFTPMHEDGTINKPVIRDYYHFLKHNGIKGAFIIGSTGEGVSMSVNERIEVMDAWAASTGGDTDFKVIPLLGGTCLADAIELAKHARKAGLHAVSFTAPFYFKPSSVDMLAQSCMEVAGAVPDMPFYYYHIPVLTGVNFLMYDLLQTLDGKLPNLAGIKYTHEDFMDFLSCLYYKDGKYDLLWGRDENMLSALVLGAKGAIGSTFNYAAPLYQQMIAAFDQGDLKKARALQLKSVEMIRLLGKYGGIATGKAYMKLVNLDCGEFRLPVKNMTPGQFEEFKRDVKALQFDEFKSSHPD